jgi:hypothetical protein
MKYFCALLLLLLFMSMWPHYVTKLQLQTGLSFIPQVIRDYGEIQWNNIDRGNPHIGARYIIYIRCCINNMKYCNILFIDSDRIKYRNVLLADFPKMKIGLSKSPACLFACVPLITFEPISGISLNLVGRCYIFNLVASAIPKWRTFELLRCVQRNPLITFGLFGGFG